jgi:acyl-CoA reductase-like NAD-dependent aldehyde dehydrogenase
MSDQPLALKLYIDGAWRDSSDAAVLDVRNPANGTHVGTAAQATRADVVAAIEAARRAFDDGPWPRMSPHERREILLSFVAALERRYADLVELNIAEAGSVRSLAETGQVGAPIAFLRDLVEQKMPRFDWEDPIAPFIIAGVGINQGVVRREPYGVAALISAYNFPLYLSLAKLGPALVAGCTTVLKPAPTTPLQGLILGEVADEAGLPAGVLNIVTGDVDAGKELTTNPLVDLVSFTGSDTVGRIVYQQAAASMKKVVLELGGKSVNVVCEDADLDKAVAASVFGMTFHAGQGCSLQTRTLVHRSIYDEFAGRVVAAVRAMKVGDPADPEVEIGPLISAAQRDKVESLISVGIAEGATVALGGGRPSEAGTGYFVEPTVFTAVSNSMAIAQTEFFGPVGVLIPFEDDAEAVRLANDSRYGLGGGVWARDPSRAYDIALQIRTGVVSVNGGMESPTTSAFGGYKQSGLGREWGTFGISEFLQTKTVAWGVFAQ